MIYIGPYVSIGKGSSVHLDDLFEVSHDTAAMPLSGRTGTVTASEDLVQVCIVSTQCHIL